MASPIYRQKFREILRAADLEKHVDPTVWRKWWEVNVKPVSDGRAVLKYLAPYVFRVAISDNRILECTDESVTYKYTPSGTKTTKTRTVDGVKFVRGFLQHALPKSFLKVRYYGWMASNSRTTRDRVKWLVWLFLGWTYWLASGVAPQPDRYVLKRPPCEHCGGMLHLIAITDGSWPNPRESRAAICRAGRSRHKLSGQRMMTMNERDIFDRRTIFKTRNQPCRIAVRADHEKCEQITKTRRRNCGVCTSFGDQQKRVRPINPASVRFTENRTLKTANSQRRCRLRFPYGTGRRNSTGLLEQMP